MELLVVVPPGTKVLYVENPHINRPVMADMERIRELTQPYAGVPLYAQE